MKLMGVIIVLLCLLFGFLCVFAATAGGWDLVHNKPEDIGEAILNWCLVLITLVIGMACFACCPLVIEEM